MIEGKILDPVFVDLQKTIVKFKLEHGNGSTSEAQLSVPPNQSRGVNPYWDEILDNYDVEAMRKARNDQEILMQKEQTWINNKRAASAESEKLKELFNAKTSAFKQPYVANASDDVKSAIRRCSDQFTLNAILHHQMMNYMQQNNFNFVQLLDHIEDYKEAQDLASSTALAL